MRLHGIHHITAITAYAPDNLDFYAGLLGLRFVKKTVNFDDPTAYHLYYGDEQGTPGSILTFFEYPGVPRGQAGDGMIHRITWRVGGEEALDFWEKRLSSAGIGGERAPGRLGFRDPEGLGLELVVGGGGEQPLVAASTDVPRGLALEGFAGVRAYSARPQHSRLSLEETLGFEALGEADPEGWRVAGGGRSSTYAYDPAPAVRPVQGAGTVHHIAWAVPPALQVAWRERVVQSGLYATQVIDRTYFRSVYFREPSGVLFELATEGPGFTVDEPLEQLGRELRLPPQHEHLRQRLERQLTPLGDPRRIAA
jgi:glyoxalase family protein